MKKIGSWIRGKGSFWVQVSASSKCLSDAIICWISYYFINFAMGKLGGSSGWNVSDMTIANPVLNVKNQVKIEGKIDCWAAKWYWIWVSVVAWTRSDSTSTYFWRKVLEFPPTDSHVPSMIREFSYQIEVCILLWSTTISQIACSWIRNHPGILLISSICFSWSYKFFHFGFLRNSAWYTFLYYV